MPRTFGAVSVLLGTMIGAGILGIPYVVMKAGFWIGAATMLFVAILLLILNLYLGEIGLRTRTNHHLTGYAELYLGKKGKLIMFLAFAFGIYSALIAYIIGEGESFSFLFFGTATYALHFSIGFWLLLTVVTFFGLKALRDGEEIGMMVIFILIISIVVFYWNKVDVNNLTYINPQLFYLPFGVILFAFLGFAAIPEVERILKTDKHLTKRTIWITTLLALAIYLSFTIIVVGSQGSKTPELATIILGKPFILLGIFTMFTSYLGLTIALVDTLHFDFHKSKTKAWLYTNLVPLAIFLILFLFDKVSFIKVLGIGGVISGGLVGILILLMVKNAKRLGNRKPEYSMPYSRILAGIIILVLIIGAFLEITNSI